FEERSYFSRDRRPVAACTVDFDQSAEDISALIAALTFGPAENPLGLAKVDLDGACVLVLECAVLDSRSEHAPGTVVTLDEHGMRVSTATRDIALRNLRTADGQPLSALDLAARFELYPGSRLPALTEERAQRLTTLHRGSARHEVYWVKRLAKLE